MEWRDTGFVLAARRHGESGVIVELLTAEHGRHAGLVRGGQSPKLRAVLQPGNKVAATWRGRLAEHLGMLSCELVRAHAARFLDDPDRLAALAAATAIIAAALPEREPQPDVFVSFEGMIEALDSGTDWLARYIGWERDLLAALGFGLDLGRCAVTGVTTDLAYVSPRTGRAVSRAAGLPYHDKLLALPGFLWRDEPADALAVMDVTNTERAVVIGNSPNEQFWTLQMERSLEPLKNHLTALFYNRLSFDEILRAASSLPPNSAIFWVQSQVDARGTMREGDRALRELAAVANAPIFSYDDAYFDGDIVGGPMSSVSETTKRTTEVALRILGGEKPATITTPVMQYGPPKYDWRQLQRWGIRESRLPPGSDVQFREPTMWDRYRWHMAVVCAVILLQAVLISGLFYEHRRRQLAEAQVGRRTAQLIHSNRFAVAGELTATMAHELNQPLGAILANADTAEILLKSSAPDLQELREIVTDIRRDDQRASEVLRRLRSMLARSPFENRNFDLNEIARESIQLLSILSMDRKVDLSAFTAPMPLLVKGDSVQLQQVISNLVVNAMDAMSKTPRGERRVIVRTVRADNFAEVSVSDTGPGIPSDKFNEVFEPFFTTKPHGMGIGLSIARTIAEAHDGRIWAENQAEGGAVFHVRLPLSRA